MLQLVDGSWIISDLCERVADALAASPEVPGGKARSIPDERSIRYYTTLGLIDRPTLRGRTAYYGARHLAQLIAIKRMQVDGASLAEIQELLPALSDAALGELTGVALTAKPRPAARRDFWRASPQPVVPEPAPESGSGSSFTAEHHLELAPGVRLSISASRVPTDADADALRVAAATVLAELVRRRLIPTDRS